MALFSVTVRPYADKTKPHLKYVLRVRHPDRQVERYFFETKKKADAEAATKSQDVENLGVRALNLDPGQKVEAMAAFERLKPHGASLMEAVALALELGHQSNALIFSNYRRRLSEAEAEEYFDCPPR